MKSEPRISFHGMDPSPAMAAIIREKIGKLERFHDRITGCRVAVEKRSRRGHKGHIFHVAIEVDVPGGRVIVNRKPGDAEAHEDLAVAIRDSFDAARRQLEDHARKADQVHAKVHPPREHGRVTRFFPDGGYGFVTTAGGADVYFDRDSVAVEEWRKLGLGSELEFTRMEGDRGPFTANVTVRETAV